MTTAVIRSKTTRGLVMVTVMTFWVLADCSVQAQLASPAHLVAETAAQRQAAKLIRAAEAGDTTNVASILNSGVSVDAISLDGRTALIAATQSGQLAVARKLIEAGANLNFDVRYLGSALNIAENRGDAPLAALLLRSGAHSSGKSIGDTVCVRPWQGNGYCGVVTNFTVRAVHLSVTQLVGCGSACPASPECSAGRPVGGPNGVKPGDVLAVPSWCLTHTGVKP